MATINGVEVIGDKSAHDFGLLDNQDKTEIDNGIERNRKAAEDNHEDIVLHRTDTDVHVTPAWKNSLVTKEILGLYWTAAQTADIINEISIAGGAKLVKVDELPEAGQEQTIYLVPKTDPQAGDVFDEYVWVDGKYEFIGTTKADLSGYFPITGGALTGNIIERNTDSDHLGVSGSYWGHGAYLWLSGQNSGYAGAWYLSARDTEKSCDLIGTPSGVLSWGGKLVATEDDLANCLPKTTTLESLSTNSIPFHNAYPRCKYLGTSITDAQNEAIKNRTYDDLFIGDYWTINGVNWRIVAIDPYYNVGDVNFDKGNIIVMPDTVLYNAQMNETNTTAGAYHGSLMRTQNLNNARTIAQNAFGSHLANHIILLANSVDGTGPNNWSWYDSDGVELPNEVQIYGTRVWGSALKGFDVATQKQQFPLMAIAPQFVNTRQNYWLQDVSSSSVSGIFAVVNTYGYVGTNYASASLGVRPSVTLTYI